MIPIVDLEARIFTRKVAILGVASKSVRRTTFSRKFVGRASLASLGPCGNILGWF